MFYELYRDDIKDAVEKTIRCGTRDLGYARYECLGCEQHVNAQARSLVQKLRRYRRVNASARFS